MEYSVSDLQEFIRKISGAKQVNPNSDIFAEVGMVGDEFQEMIEKFADTFTVDMSDYLWYFHTDEEGYMSIGGIFFKPPYNRVTRIPVTPAMLTEFANKGKWDLKYPAHKLPAYRYDILINKILTGLFLAGFSALLFLKYLK